MEIVLPEPEQALRTRTLSHRGLQDYLQICGLTDKDIRNKHILDLGSGPDCRFAAETAAVFPETDVTSFDAIFIDPPQPLKRKWSGDLSVVGGHFTALPFPDASFDLVISSFAMPIYLEGEATVKQALAEIHRVLRIGGKAHLAPFQFHRRTVFGPPLKEQRKLKEELECYGSNFPGFVSSTIVLTGGAFHDTMLEEVLYDREPEIFHRLMQAFDGQMEYTFSRSVHPDLIAPHDCLAILRKAT